MNTSLWVENNLQRLQKIKEEIEAVCESSNRHPEEITLLLVTKTIPLEVINKTLELGISENLLNPDHIYLGENKVQEAQEKFQAWEEGIWEEEIMPHSKNFHRHFIGHLQTNKVNKILPLTHLLHSLDRWSLAEKIIQYHQNRQPTNNAKTEVLLQVNVAEEASKFGLRREEVEPFIAKLLPHSAIRIKGLMMMAPHAPPDTISHYFSQMKQLVDTLNHQFRDQLPQPLTTLSMGMSNDYLEAIRHGATIIRIGSALFGERNIP